MLANQLEKKKQEQAEQRKLEKDRLEEEKKKEESKQKEAKKKETLQQTPAKKSKLDLEGMFRSQTLMGDIDISGKGLSDNNCDEICK